ncbi:MAG: hypothetical protein GY835_02615 [bacterium]|nr:hypothetical protein [bacterium]
MAKPIQAISKYRPRLKKRGVARKGDMSGWMAERTLLTEGQARASLSDFAGAARFYLLNRQDVELEGLGKLILDIGLDGKLSLSLQVETEFMETLDTRYDKSAETIENAENIGKTSVEMYDLWDEEHPDDLVERG